MEVVMCEYVIRENGVRYSYDYEDEGYAVIIQKYLHMPEEPEGDMVADQVLQGDDVANFLREIEAAEEHGRPISDVISDYFVGYGQY
jgi:hypothetical protein